MLLRIRMLLSRVYCFFVPAPKSVDVIINSLVVMVGNLDDYYKEREIEATDLLAKLQTANSEMERAAKVAGSLRSIVG